MRKSISQLNMLSPEEYSQVVRDFNNTAVDYPRDKCVHTLFEEQVDITPNKVALVFDKVKFTYSKLNSTANAVAIELQKSGVSRNDMVAIISKRSWHTVVAILAILKVGAAYLPIDYNYPIDRINYILKDSNCKSALTYGIDFKVDKQICMEQIDYNKDYANLETKVDNMDLCAVIYTSGSTGEPKGTLLHHKGVVNYAFGNDALYRGGECVISYATYTFDAFLLDTVLPMIRGTKCVLATEEEQFSQKPFEKLIESNNNCNMFITPAKLKQFILGSESKEFLKNISKICIGGEMFPTELLPYFDEKTQIFNVYGPTECSLWSSEGDLQGVTRVQHKSIKLKDIEVLSNTELKTVTKDFNDTAVDYPRDKCVHTLFEEQVAKAPDKVAVIACDRTISYKELNEQSNRIAHSLIAKGVKPNNIIAFMLPRKSCLLSVMFGILKSGAAYMPIDPDYPQDRIDYMLKDSNAKFCITEENISELLANEKEDNPNFVISSDNYYCALHTSGSTGNPKMSILKHSNLQNFINGNKQFFENVEISVSATIITFDAFILDTVVPLCQGIPLKLLCNDEIYNQALFEEAFNNIHNAMFFSTPTKLKHYIESSETKAFAKNISSFIVGGELFTTELRDLIRKYNTNANVFNIYGPTEDTICISYEKV